MSVLVQLLNEKIDKKHFELKLANSKLDAVLNYIRIVDLRSFDACRKLIADIDKAAHDTKDI